MKMLLLFATIGLVTSCGVVEKLDKNCGSDLNEFCNMTFGVREDDQDATIKDIVNKNNEQDARLAALEQQNEQLIDSMNSFSEQIEQLGNTDVSNKTYLESLITSLQNTVISNSIQLVNISTSLNTLQGDLVALDTALSKTIVATIDPCNDYPGHFDEVLLKTKDGKFISYFEEGGKRFLSILIPGNFTTTDRQACNFSLSASGVITF